MLQRLSFYVFISHSSHRLIFIKVLYTMDNMLQFLDFSGQGKTNSTPNLGEEKAECYIKLFEL